jgi:DNA-directed RNA polymerase subunit RPC12/RpoP
VSITRCSECRDPAHASETDDADRCGKCRLRAIIGGRVPLISFDVDDAADPVTEAHRVMSQILGAAADTLRAKKENIDE